MTEQHGGLDNSIVEIGTDDEPDKAIIEAERIGTEHGKAAGSWVVDGNTGTDQLRDIAQAIEEGEFLASLDMSGPLSGEWADGYSIEQLLADCGVGPYEDAQLDDTENYQRDNIATAYEDAYWSAFEAEAERSVRVMLPDDSAYNALDSESVYRVSYFGGAVRLDGPGDSNGTAWVVMVGDDRRHQVSIDDLEPIGADDYCPTCGQTGPNHDMPDA
jgi:hypothetical protein